MLRRVLAVSLLLTLAACSGGGEGPAPAPSAPAPPPAPAPLPKVRLQLNWFPEPEFGGMYAAKERGLFAKHGLDVELLQGGADVPAPQLLASGKVELAVVSADQLLTLREAGGKVKAVFAAFQKAPRVIVVKDASPHQTLEALWKSDATVMAADGLAFAKWLNAQYGGKKLKFVPYAGSSAPLISGSVDAMQGFATAEPVQLQLDGVPVRSFVVADTGFNPYEVVVAANEEWLAKEPALARAAVEALRDGWRSYLDDPAAINAAMSAVNADMKPAVMDASAKVLPQFVESDDTKAHGLGTMTLERWTTLGAQLVSMGLLQQAPDAAACFVNPVPDAPAVP